MENKVVIRRCRCSTEMLEKIKGRAQAKDRSISDTAGQILREYLDSPVIYDPLDVLALRMPLTASFVYSISDESWNALKSFSCNAGSTVSQIVRMAVYHEVYDDDKT